jgi:comEA protein
MGAFSSLQQLFGFTRNELKVILFLAVTFLAGLAFRWFDPFQNEVESFDYSTQDSLFLARSQQFMSLPTQEDSTEGKERKRRRKSEPKKDLQPQSIDLNSATKDELMLLPGIGEAYAERIVIHREDHGPFRSVEDLEQVKGIGKKIIARLRPFVRVDLPQP